MKVDFRKEAPDNTFSYIWQNIMKRIFLVLMCLCLLFTFTACSKDKDDKSKKTSASKEVKKKKLEKVLPLEYPKGVNPAAYTSKILKKGTPKEKASDISAYYKFLLHGDKYSILDSFSISLSDVATCCATESVTKCYLNHITNNKWTTATEFRKLWTKELKALPKKFSDKFNDPDVAFDDKLRFANDYGYLSYPFISYMYNSYFMLPYTKPIVDGCEFKYEMSETEANLLSSYYMAYELEEHEKTAIKNYLANYIKFNPLVEITVGE